MLWILIYLLTFFVWYNHPNSDEHIDQYKTNLNDNIFTCMELMKISYHDVVLMPVYKFYELLKWKQRLEEEKTKMIKKNQQEINS